MSRDSKVTFERFLVKVASNIEDENDQLKWFREKFNLFHNDEKEQAERHFDHFDAQDFLGETFAALSQNQYEYQNNKALLYLQSPLLLEQEKYLIDLAVNDLYRYPLLALETLISTNNINEAHRSQSKSYIEYQNRQVRNLLFSRSTISYAATVDNLYTQIIRNYVLKRMNYYIDESVNSNNGNLSGLSLIEFDEILKTADMLVTEVLKENNMHNRSYKNKNNNNCNYTDENLEYINYERSKQSFNIKEINEEYSGIKMNALMRNYESVDKFGGHKFINDLFYDVSSVQRLNFDENSKKQSSTLSGFFGKDECRVIYNNVGTGNALYRNDVEDLSDSKLVDNRVQEDTSPSTNMEQLKGLPDSDKTLEADRILNMFPSNSNNMLNYLEINDSTCNNNRCYAASWNALDITNTIMKESDEKRIITSNNINRRIGFVDLYSHITNNTGNMEPGNPLMRTLIPSSFNDLNIGYSVDVPDSSFADINDNQFML